MIKVLDISLGQVRGLSLLGTPGVPVIAPGRVLTSGYYTEQTTGQVYYYDAANDRWYYYAAGFLYPLAITWKPSPSAKVEMVGGVDKLRFNLTLKYSGPAVTRSFYAAVGDNKTSGGFAEWDGWQITKSIDIPAYSAPTLVTGKYIDVPIKTGRGGYDGAAYVKILDGFTLTEGVNTTPYYYDVFHITPPEGIFTEFGITTFVKV